MSVNFEMVRNFFAKLSGRGDKKQRLLRHYEKLEDKYNSKKRDNEDNQVALENDIQIIEKRVLQLKQEYDNTPDGRGNKRILKGKIERHMKLLDEQNGRKEIIEANLERIDITLTKIAEIKAALIRGVEEGELDDIGLEYQEVSDDYRDVEKATESLKKERMITKKYNKWEDKEGMARQLEEEIISVDLSPETEKKLKQLEKE